MAFDNYYDTYKMKLIGNRLVLPQEIGEKIASRNVLPCTIPVAECNLYKFHYLSVQDPTHESSLALKAEERTVRGRTERSIMFSDRTKKFLFPGLLQSRTVTLIGNHDFFEIWTPKIWEEYRRFVETPEKQEQHQHKLRAACQL